MSIELWERIVKDLVLTQSMIKTRQAVTSADYLPPSKQAQEDNDDDDDDDNDVEDKSVYVYVLIHTIIRINIVHCRCV